MWIKREISHVLQERVKQRPAVLITGCRQSGKTSLLKTIFPDYTYVTLDVPLHAREASAAGDMFLEKHGTPVIIDEIQYSPEILRSIKIAIDNERDKTGSFLLTGSQKFSLMEGVSESLAGRVSIIELNTLSMKELERHFGEIKTQDGLLSIIFKGGYPEIHSRGLSPVQFFDDYLATYIERDVRKIIHIKDLAAFDRFVRLLALRSGQLLSMNSLASDTGVSSHTVKNWISVLEVSNIIYLLQPYYENLGKRIVKTPKVYFLDSGLLLYLLGIHSVDGLLNSPLLGNIFESFCMGQIVRSFQNRGQKPDVYFFRDSHGHEIDFIIPRNGNLNLLEAKWLLNINKADEVLRKIETMLPPDRIDAKIILTSGNHYGKIGGNEYISGPSDPLKYLEITG